jgi:shikimate kinase
MADERGPLYASVADVVIDVSDRSVESVVELLIDALDEDQKQAGK